MQISRADGNFSDKQPETGRKETSLNKNSPSERLSLSSLVRRKKRKGQNTLYIFPLQLEICA